MLSEVPSSAKPSTTLSRTSSTGRGRFAAFAPPSISDTLLAPLLGTFQHRTERPVQVLVTDRFVDLIAEGIDLVFRLAH